MHAWALFEDQSTSRLLCDFFAADPGDDPVRLVFPDLEDTRVRHSASNGCLAAYQVLYQLGYVNPGEHFCLSFQFADPHRYFNSHGSSAGLAFCLKFAQEIYRLKTGRRLDHSIAATGSISDGTRGARVEKVQALRHKLLAAFEVLSPGDAVFFPAENETDLDPELRDLAADKEIRLVPVATVDQAVRALLPSHARIPQQWRRAVPFILAMAGLVGLFFLATQPFGPGRQMTKMARSLFPADSLRIEGFFHYRSSASHGTRAIPSLGLSGPALTLCSGDLYKFSFTAGDSCYLYVFQMDTRGQVEQWPDPSSLAGPLRLEPGVMAQIPPDLDDWLILDQQVGQDLFSVLAVRERDRQLEDLYAGLRRAAEAKKRDWKTLLQERLKDFRTFRDPGAVYLAEFAVLHTPASPLPLDSSSADLQIDFPIAMAFPWGAQRGIYSMDSDGANLKKLISHPGVYFNNPSWSPDGKRIAFSAERADQREVDIFVMNADGSGQTNLTHHPGSDDFPSWSPDGRWIVFSSNRGKSNPDDYDLYRMGADGGDLCPLDTTSDRTEQPSWSPDGDRIAYVRSTTFDDHRLWLTNADGSEHRILNPSLFPINATAPAWSSDARRLFFVGTIPGLPSRLGCINADGSGGLTLASEGNDTQPHLSPEGRAALVCRSYGPERFAPTALGLDWPNRVLAYWMQLPFHGIPPAFSWGEGFRRVGEARMGAKAVRQALFVNRGKANLEITGLTFSDPQFGASKQRFILAPGESRIIDLVFAPEKVGTSYSTLHITNSDAASPDIDLILNGTGLPNTPSDTPARAL